MAREFNKNKPFRKTNSGTRKRSSGTGRSEERSVGRGGRKDTRPPFEKSTEKPFGENPFRKSKESREADEAAAGPQSFERKSFNPNRDLKREGGSYFEKKRKNLGEEERKSERNSERSSEKKFERKSERPFEKKPERPAERKPERPAERKPERPAERKSGSAEYNKPGEQPFFKKAYPKRSVRSTGYKKVSDKPEPVSDGLIRLNKYISNAGICSRREADELISAGTVKVNGKIVTEMGYKVKPEDQINYGGETLRKEKLVYVLLNKPKDFITTLEDPGNRKTVFDLVRKACKERIYPVGRLDRNTTGVLLLTNDGDLTKKLTHPKHGLKKIYQVTLDKPLGKPDMDEIAKNGVTLEDGHIQPDVISYSGDGANKKEVGLEIHSGRNRIVRRLFEHLGFEVIKLDRVVFAGLTKKDLPRGNWRLLSEQEVGFLKMLA
jgi:23S rRNA pseudouridine2605 synthase